VFPLRLVEDWTEAGPADGAKLHRVAISMKQCPRKRELMEEFFWQVSDPRSPKYANYLSAEESLSYLAASDEKLEIVTSFLASNNIVGVIAPTKNMVFAEAPISTLENLFQTKFHTFTSKKYKLQINRIVAPYSLPDEVANVVALVDGLIVFPGLMAAAIEADAPETGGGTWPNYCNGAPQCMGLITPNVTAQMYNSYSLTSGAWKVASGNGIAVAEFQTQKYDPADLTTFATACNIPVISVIDVNKDGSGPVGGTETMLDLELCSGNGLGIPLSDYFYFDYSLITWANQVVAQNGAGPLVYSVSYGNDEVQQSSTEYMYQCNSVFMAAANLGYSILFASGDQGVWGRSGVGTTFHPDFPATSPYITAVGGTDFTSTTPSLTNYVEKCSTDGGGGFSNTFAIPAYQAAAVANYIAIAGAAGNLPKQSYWNATGRAYPDISAEFGLVVPFCIVSNGKWFGVGGTSASCPTVAHGISVLNNIQLTAGKKPLGFLNQWLYQTLASAALGTYFTDITLGQNNEGVGTGFSAMPGWDPCSGVGTPNFAMMAKAMP